MSTPTRGMPLRPCALPTRHLLLDYRLLALWLALSLAPLLSFGQGNADGPSDRSTAIGLRVGSSQQGFFGVGYSPFPELTVRQRLGPRWSLEGRVGYWQRSGEVTVGRGLVYEQRRDVLRASIVAQRAWRLNDRGLSFYAGAGLGVLRYATRNITEVPGSLPEGSSYRLTVEGIVGLRYRLPDAPFEFDLSINPNYAGRGFGLDVAPSVGVRFDLGGRR